MCSVPFSETPTPPSRAAVNGVATPPAPQASVSCLVSSFSRTLLERTWNDAEPGDVGRRVTVGPAVETRRLAGQDADVARFHHPKWRHCNRSELFFFNSSVFSQFVR